VVGIKFYYAFTGSWGRKPPFGKQGLRGDTRMAARGWGVVGGEIVRCCKADASGAQHPTSKVPLVPVNKATLRKFSGVV